ncbi:MAG: sarcosine oxidase subunit gamma [Pseudomonadota bacterium]
MVSLIAKSALAGLMPLEGDGVVAREAPFAPIYSLAPLGDGLGPALEKADGIALPAPGKMTDSEGLRCAWFGRAHYLLFGAEPDASLSALAAITDQSDAWCHAILEGPRASETLAYRTPVDLRASSFPPMSATKAQIGHMNAALLHPEAERYEILVFRSMAGTLVHELEDAIAALP